MRRLDLSPRVLRYETFVAAVAVAVTLMFAIGAGVWVLDNGGAGPTGIYRVGTIDFVGLGVMVVASAIACRAALRAHDAVTATRFTTSGSES